jgi:hypothetical protein
MPKLQLPKFPPELALVIACSRWPLGEEEAQAVRSLLSSPLDWTRFLGWVGRHRIAPLVHRNLLQAAGSLIPDSVAGQLRDESARNAQRVLMQLAESRRIMRLLAEAGIRSLMMKGPVLSVLAFGDPLLRDSQDVDLLIDPARVHEADRVFVEAGYRRISPGFALSATQYKAYRRLRCQFAYLLESRGVIQELHWRLSSNATLLPLEEAAIWGRLEPLAIAGAGFTTLPDEELFLYLCVHGGVHMWFRLKWLADIAALLRRLPADRVERVASRARSLQLHRPFHQALILAHELMAAPVPADILSAAYQDKPALRLAVVACQALAWGGSPAEPSETRWFTPWVNWHSFRLKPGLRFCWSEFQDQMCSPEDWARMPLPEPLYFLYLPLRPLSWVVRKLLHAAPR